LVYISFIDGCISDIISSTEIINIVLDSIKLL